MKYIFFLLIIVVVNTEDLSTRSFPNDFTFGTSTSALQIEGGSKNDGRGISIWEDFIRSDPSKIADRSNMDVTCDSYHKTKEDVTLLKQLGVDFYRFSISWSRILPYGFRYYVNQAGIDYYNELINELLANNITPIVTMYHWELPLSLSDLGGFVNNEMVTWFEEYAKVLFENFGDRVTMWITFNEPTLFCNFGYGDVVFPPAINQSGIGDYLCAHNTLKAHAAVYHLYHKHYNPFQNGRIGIALHMIWYEPGTNSDKDKQAAERQLQFEGGNFLHPILSQNGDYPSIMKELIGKRSLKEGFSKSRLPQFTPDEIQLIKGTIDFLGLNHYTTFLTYDQDGDAIGKPSQYKDTEVLNLQDDSWPLETIEPFRAVPWGIRKLLKWIKNSYGDIDIYIMENGHSGLEDLNDYHRIHYHQTYLSNILDAIHEDEVKVKGYAVWSFLDAFEWISGHTVSFGLYHVNFSDPNRPRTAKKSAKFYADLIKNRRLSIPKTEL
ncbi:hypothetical protein FQA39_LY11652 [Lamprigera yunnana]|nr:hypothetical protein FQA39_LY11652 [Lamprigera yunnana]